MKVKSNFDKLIEASYLEEASNTIYYITSFEEIIVDGDTLFFVVKANNHKKETGFFKFSLKKSTFVLDKTKVSIYTEKNGVDKMLFFSTQRIMNVKKFMKILMKEDSFENKAYRLQKAIKKAGRSKVPEVSFVGEGEAGET